MQQNKVVIGANFGDEGKGLMTDYFVSEFDADCMVVRFNGGAQAGHTVVTPELERHKFSHFGSGTLQKAPTYLSKFFIVNPMLFMQELSEFNFPPGVYVDKRCLVSTPYDMYLNQVEERMRGEGRHGSCGVGINETINRSLEEQFCFTAVELKDEQLWQKKLDRIADEYFPRRLKELGQPDPGLDRDKFYERFDGFVEHVEICDDDIMDGCKLVLEGAQGLLLDQNHRFFPHVTRSNTGFQNVKTLLYEAWREYDETEVVYVTRTYLTRHGRGPFPTEVELKPYADVRDVTNVYNEFQEGLRFGLIDLNGLVRRIKRDMESNGLTQVSIAITCLDQSSGLVRFYEDNQLLVKKHTVFVSRLRQMLPCKNIYLSFGPTRDSVYKARGSVS